jgi:hypothetical protein
MVTGTVMAGAFFKNLADTMEKNREYLKAKQGMLEEYFLKTGFQERADLKKARAERAKLLDQADKFNIDKEAAAILYSTGQLPSIIGYLNKIEQSEDPDKKVNKTGLKRFSEAIVASVPEEKVGAAMKYAFDLGAAEDPSSDKLVEAIHATSLDEYTNLDASGEILNNAVDFYVSEMSDPLKSRSGAEVIKDIFNRVDSLTEDPTITLRDIAENFKTFQVPPPFQGPMPLSPDNVEETIINEETET